MTRMIDADALSKKLCETTIFVKDGEVFQRMINDAPTIDPDGDKVEVVRCKDCIYYETCNLSSSHWWKGGYTVDIEFCSFGERREP